MPHQLLPPKWLIYWIFLPILAHVISIKTGFILFGLFFPILLPTTQWYALRQHPTNKHPAYWFISLFFLFLAGYVIRLMNLPVLQTDISVGLILAFYVSQCLAELVLYRMFSTWRWGWFSIANVITCFVWYQLFLAQHHAKLAYSVTQIRTDNWLHSNYWYYLTIPVVASLTNLLTGLGLLKATQAN